MNCKETLPVQCAGVDTLADVEGLETPAFVYDEAGLHNDCVKLRAAADAAGCIPLFAIKSFSYADAISKLVPPLKGFATSSVFESRLARAAIDNGGAHVGTVHMTSPGLKSGDVDKLAKLCDYISFNSLSQVERLMPAFLDRRKKGEVNKCELGLRINPQLSFIKDARYDPCRQHSKLGVPLSQLVEVLETTPAKLNNVTGIHVHNNCESENLSEIAQTIDKVETHLANWLQDLSWINLGGGYDFSEFGIDVCAAIQRLKEIYGLAVFIEPGTSISRANGYIVASVLDIFDSEGKQIALLDTSVNHMPEVFEYQFEPDVVGDYFEGDNEYLLTGCTCLAGDVFGLYGFDTRLEIGSRLVFPDMGAYTSVKSHTFNGVPLPNVYALTADGRLNLKKRYLYDDYANLYGGWNNVAT